MEEEDEYIRQSFSLRIVYILCVIFAFVNEVAFLSSRWTLERPSSNRKARREREERTTR